MQTVSKWSDSDKKAIAEAYTALTLILNTYGKDDLMKERLRAWQAVLEPDYTADQVCAAMMAHAKQSREMPTPADLIKIIDPPEPKITYAEYKHALEQHALEGYPMFGYFGQVIKDYQRQQANETPSYQQILEKRQQWALENKTFARIGSDNGSN
jgi:hypothetical protein